MRRSIPACAGEPIERAGIVSYMKVYPRVCGGTWEDHFLPPADQGLSPRVRGNLWLRAEEAVSTRSIPACAGEP